MQLSWIVLHLASALSVILNKTPCKLELPAVFSTLKVLLSFEDTLLFSLHFLTHGERERESETVRVRHNFLKELAPVIVGAGKTEMYRVGGWLGRLEI